MAEPTPTTQPEEQKPEENKPPSFIDQIEEIQARGALSAPSVRAEARERGVELPTRSVWEYADIPRLGPDAPPPRTGGTLLSSISPAPPTTATEGRRPFPPISTEAEPIGLPSRRDETGDIPRRKQVDYSLPEAPQGWNPEPQEVDRLVEAGLLDRRDSADNRLVWQAGRADLGRRGGMGWVDQMVAQELVTDVQRGESAVQKALWTEVPVSMIRGTPVINTYEMNRKAESLWLAKIYEEENVHPWNTSEEDQAEYRKEAKRRAARTMTRVMQSGGRRYWADPLERDLTDDIMKSNAVWRMFRSLASPVRYGAAGYGTPDAQLDALARSHLIVSGQQLKYENPLVTIGRFAPSTLVTAGIATGTWPWERESVEAVRAGEDIIYHVGDVGRWLSGREQDDDLPLWAQIASGALIVGTIIAEPDLPSLILMGPGAVAKSKKASKINRRLAKTARLGGPISEMVRAGRITVPEASARLQSLDEAVARAVEGNAGAKARVGGVINEQLGGMYERAAKLQEDAAAKRSQVDDLVKEYEGEYAQRTAAKLQAEADEMDYAAAVLGSLAAEAEKNAFLMAHGLDWAAAERVTTRGSLPINSRAAREARRNATAFENKAADLRRIHKKEFDAYEEAAENYINILESLSTSIHTGKKKPVGVAEVGREAESATRKRTYRAPVIGQELSFKTERGGTRRGIVEDIEVVHPNRRRPPKRKPKKNPEGGYHVVVKVRTSKGIETVRTPYRVEDWATAVGVNGARDNFMRWHEVVARPDGPLDLLTTYERGAVDARAFALALEEAGPAAGAVGRYEEAISTLKASRSKYESSSKAVGEAFENEKEIFKKWLKAEPAAVRAEARAKLADEIPEIYADAIDDILQGLENFRTRGLANLGLIDTRLPGVIDPRQAWKARKLSRDQIEKWGSEVDDAAVESTYRGIVEEVFTLKGTARTSTVQVSRLVDELEASAGPEFVQDYIQSGKAKRLKSAMDEAGISVGPKKGPRAPTEVARPFDQTAELQAEVRDIIRAGEANKLFESGEAWGRAVFNAWNDLNLVRTKGGPLKLFGSRLDRLAKTYARMGNNIAVRIGEVGPELESAIIQIDRLFSRAQLELTEVGRSARLGDTPEARLTTFMDATVALPLKEGMTRWMISTGNGSVFSKGQMQILADTRINPRTFEKQEEAAESIRKSLASRLGKRLSKEFVVEGEAFRGETIRKAIEEGLDDDLLFRLAMRGERAFDGVPKSLVAISRMWVPGYALKTIPDSDGIMLLGASRTILKNSKTYEEYSKKMRKATHAILGDHASNVSKAHASGASGFMLGATLGEFGHRMERIIGGKITQTEAADVNRILSGAFEDVADIDRGIAVLNKLGIPFTQAEIRTAKGVTGDLNELGIRSKELIEIGTKSGGSTYFPRTAVEEVEKRAARISKDLRAQALAPRQFDGTRWALSQYLNLWRGSAVTGLIIPNPRYWTNNMMGDFSQLWIQEGLGFAARRSFINFPANIPLFGRGLQMKSLYMAELVGGKSGRAGALTGIIETFFNPHLGQIFAGKAGEFVTKNGDVVTYDQLRKMALEDGITETFIREELMEMFSSATRGAKPWEVAFDKLGDVNRAIADHANLVQERQRMGMYADLILRGVPRQEAAARTKRALYDWSHGIAEWEARTVARIVPFWRFWRLSLAQCADALIEPMVRPAGEVASKALRGRTKAARLRQQLLIWPSLPDFIDPREDRPGLSTQAKIDLLARELYPDWQDTRAKLGVVPIDPTRRRYWEEMYGRTYTHESLLLPTTTATDSMDMLFGLMVGLGSVIGKAAEYIPYSDRFLPEFQLVGDWEAKFWEPVLSSTNPFVETPVRAALDWAGADLDYTATGSWKYLSPTDEEVFNWTPGLRSEMNYDRDSGRWRVPTATYLKYRMLPVLPTQISGWMGAIKNPEWDNGFFAGTTMMLRKLTRFGDVRPFNVNDTLKGRILDIESEFEKVIDEFGDVRKVDRSIRTKGRARGRGD